MNIIEIKQYHEESDGYYTGSKIGNFENENPIAVFEAIHMTQVNILSRLFELYGVNPSHPTIQKLIDKKLKEEWIVKVQEIGDEHAKNPLLRLFSANRKKDQEKILHELTITTKQLISFIFYGWEHHKFKYSQYISENLPNNFNATSLPSLLEVEANGNINTIGTTELSDGQLKQVIDQRNVTIVKIIDNGDDWHCFFTTYDSLSGKESYKGGHPHFHYLSSKWGLTKDNVIKEFNKKRYSVPSIHVLYANDPT